MHLKLLKKLLKNCAVHAYILIILTFYKTQLSWTCTQYKYIILNCRYWDMEFESVREALLDNDHDYDTKRAGGKMNW